MKQFRKYERYEYDWRGNQCIPYKLECRLYDDEEIAEKTKRLYPKIWKEGFVFSTNTDRKQTIFQIIKTWFWCINVKLWIDKQRFKTTLRVIRAKQESATWVNGKIDNSLMPIFTKIVAV